MAAVVYQFTNMVTGEIYVGQTSDFSLRLYAHMRLLEQRRHHSKPLQASFDAHGWGAFRIDVLEVCKAESLLERERHWIATLKPTLNDEHGQKAPAAERLRKWLAAGRKPLRVRKARRLIVKELTQKQAVVLGLLEMGLSKASIAKSLKLGQPAVFTLASRAKARVARMSKAAQARAELTEFHIGKQTQ